MTKLEELLEKARKAKDSGETLSFKDDILKDFSKEERPEILKILHENDLLKVLKR